MLDTPSPDGRYFLVPRATQLSTLELMSRPTYRLAELELRPDTDRLWHLDTHGINALQFYDVQARRFRDSSRGAGASPVRRGDSGRIGIRGKVKRLLQSDEIDLTDPERIGWDHPRQL